MKEPDYTLYRQVDVLAHALMEGSTDRDAGP